MALGFAPYLLLQGAAIQKGAYAAGKITPVGFLSYLAQQGKPNIISSSISNGSGHIRDVRYRYRNRGIKGVSSTEDTCDVQTVAARLEATIPALKLRTRAIFYDWETIRKYEEEASNMISVTPNGKPTMANQEVFGGFMAEVWEDLMANFNGLLGDVNDDLLNLMQVNWGKNVVTGSTAATSVNFNLNGTVNNLQEGLTKIITDARANEINTVGASIVGSGYIDAVMTQLMMNAINANQSGLNAAALSRPNYYYDPAAADIFGANSFGFFEKDAMQLLEVDRYVGYFSGELGVSQFFNMTVPLTDSLGTKIADMNFDVQVIESDCNKDVSINGTPTSIGRGVTVIVSKNFGLATLPTDAYNASDRLYGANGSLKYTATNA
jgi:hypothetical protein